MGNIDGGSPGNWDGFLAMSRMRNQRAETDLRREQAQRYRRQNEEEDAVSSLARQAANPTPQEPPEPEQLSGPGTESHNAQRDLYMLSQTVSQQSGSLADQLESLARTSADAGYINKAQELGKTSALMRSREAAADASANSAALSRIRTSQREAQLVGQLFGSVNNQADWDRAIATYEFRTGKESEFRGTPFDPATAARATQEALTANERLGLEEKSLGRKAQEKYRGRRLDQIDTQNEIRDRRVTLEEEREARLAKLGGGKAITSPSVDEQQQAARMIQKDYEGLDPKDRKDAAFSIAAEARALRRRNPALDAAGALAQAYAAAKQSGDFAMNEGMGGSGLLKKPTYTGRGKSSDVPASLPPSRKELKEGRYYTNPQGQVGQWTKQGFVLVAPRRGAGGAASARDEEDDNEDDSED